MRTFSLPAIALLLACIPACSLATSQETPHSGAGRNADEKAVVGWLLDHADGQALEFLTWGPHDDKGDLKELARKAREAGRPVPSTALDAGVAAADKILRVRYRAADRKGESVYYDRLVFLVNGAVAEPPGGFPAAVDNPAGDGWLATMQQEYARAATPRASPCMSSAAESPKDGTELPEEKVVRAWLKEWAGDEPVECEWGPHDLDEWVTQGRGKIICVSYRMGAGAARPPQAMRLALVRDGRVMASMSPPGGRDWLQIAADSPRYRRNVAEGLLGGAAPYVGQRPLVPGN